MFVRSLLEAEATKGRFMGRETNPQAIIHITAIERFLQQHLGYQDAVIEQFCPLGQEIQEGLKSYGYGHPLQIHFSSQNQKYSVVLRTMSSDPFGHDRRSDRLSVLMLAEDTFGHQPQHIQPLALGCFDEEGRMLPVAKGEPFLITEYVEGSLYAEDLSLAAKKEHASPNDLLRAKNLALYLGKLHAKPSTAAAYLRSIRDTLGSGEGIFGICDNYPADHLFVQNGTLQNIETLALKLRWQLKSQSHKACQTHGDFHPFNLLFREDHSLAVLDASRGGAGDAADDLTALSINYIFFALNHRNQWGGALKEIWLYFWQSYLEITADKEILQRVALFFSWRCLVLASPIWFADVKEQNRLCLLMFAKNMLEGQSFHPETVETLLS